MCVTYAHSVVHVFNRIPLVIWTVVQDFVFAMTLFELAPWSNCPHETIERLCNRGFQEPALVGAFFDTPIAFSKWLQRPATHQECDFLFRCQSHAQSIVDDSVVRASSVRSASPPVATKRVLEEASGPLICGETQCVIGAAYWCSRNKKETIVDAKVSEENLSWITKGQAFW